MYVCFHSYIYTCIGNETLWYHRRAIADLILDKGDELLKVYGLSTLELFNHRPKTIPSTQSNFYIKLNKENNINEDMESRDQKNEDSNGHSVIESFQYIKEIFDMISTNKYEKENFILSFISWITQWLLNEVKFIQNCIDDIEAWNYSIHRQMSLRYYCYILSKINKTFSYITKSDSNVKMNLSTEKISIFENEEFDGNITDIESFLMCIRKALERTCEQLLAEDSLSRNWKYISEMRKI